jgi:hypothetical protein
MPDFVRSGDAAARGRCNVATSSVAEILVASRPGVFNQQREDAGH